MHEFRPSEHEKALISAESSCYFQVVGSNVARAMADFLVDPAENTMMKLGCY